MDVIKLYNLNNTVIIPSISRRSAAMQHRLDEDAQVLGVGPHRDLALDTDSKASLLTVVHWHI